MPAHVESVSMCACHMTGLDMENVLAIEVQVPLQVQ